MKKRLVISDNPNPYAEEAIVKYRCLLYYDDIISHERAVPFSSFYRLTLGILSK
jgi:hypothetical protein